MRRDPATAASSVSPGPPRSSTDCRPIAQPLARRPRRPGLCVLRATLPLAPRANRRRSPLVLALDLRHHLSRGIRRALLAYSTYLGHAQLVHAIPHLLPHTKAARRASGTYLPPSPRDLPPLTRRGRTRSARPLDLGAMVEELKTQPGENVAEHVAIRQHDGAIGHGFDGVPVLISTRALEPADRVPWRALHQRHHRG